MSDMLVVRVTPEQKARVEAAAANNQSVSAWVRDVCLAASPACLHCGRPAMGPGAVMRPAHNEWWCTPTCAASWACPAVARLLEDE